MSAYVVIVVLALSDEGCGYPIGSFGEVNNALVGAERKSRLQGGRVVGHTIADSNDVGTRN